MGSVYLFLQFPGGHPQDTSPEGGKLHQTVVGSDPDGVVAADLGNQRLNEIPSSEETSVNL